MILTLNDKLKESEHYQPNPKKTLINKLSNIKQDWKSKTTTQELFYIGDNMIGDYAHKNYIDYLLAAWDAHLSIVVNPDIIWYTLMCELAGIVATHTDTYRSLFTTSDKKEDIIVLSDSLTVMPLAGLMAGLKKKIPTDIDQFMPEFSTSTARSVFARYAAFADMVSPYYNYMMLLCGFPAIDVRGDLSDWTKLCVGWKVIGKLFTKHQDYVAKIQAILDEAKASLDKPEFWKKMFRLERCGSGHQYDAYGWLTEMFVDEPDTRYPENFNSHISLVAYRQLDTQKDYEMKQGLLSSIKQDGFLIPEFAHVIYEKVKPVVTPYKESYLDIETIEIRRL